MHPNLSLVTVSLAHDPLSSLAYNMITHTPLVAVNLPIKTLVAMAMANNYKDLIYSDTTKRSQNFHPSPSIEITSTLTLISILLCKLLQEYCVRETLASIKFGKRAF